MQLALDRFGRMVLPKAIRDDLGLLPGDKLDAQEQGDSIVLSPVREPDAVRRKEGVLVFTGAKPGDIERAVGVHRQQRLRHVGGWTTK